MSGVDRRAFLQSSAGAVAAFSLRDQALAAELAAPSNAPELKWEKAPCRFCGTGCGVEVGVQGGRVQAVRGDEKSPVNRGLLCVKGYHLPGFLYGVDRLTHPLRRKSDGSLEIGRAHV